MPTLRDSWRWIKTAWLSVLVCLANIPISGPSGNLTEISRPASDGATSSESPPDQTPTPTPSRESSTVEAPSCPAGWETHGRRCYNFTREPRLTWPEARQVCQKWPGGDLLVLNDTEEQSFLLSIVEHSDFGGVSTNFWIGLHRSCHSSQSNFTWVDGSAPLPELTKWEYGQPDNFYNNECCVDVLAGEEKDPWLLRDEQCMRHQGFICEIPIGPSGNLTEISTPASDGATSSESPPDQTPTPTPSRESSTVEAPSCPAGWETHGRRCYNFTREPRLTWPEARQVCQQWPGGDLLVLNDTEEQSFLWSIVEVSNFGYVLTYFWIGLHRSCRSSQSNFTWVDGGALLPELTNWETGQPDNFYNNECCVDVLAGNPKTPGLLRDEQCMRHQGFICEIPIGPSGNLTEISTPASDGATSSESPPDQTPTPTPSRESSTVEAPSCPAGWETHGRRCYNFTREPRLTWPEARQVCQQWPGGDLLVLNDSEEQSFLLSIVDHSNFGDVSTNFWIGLHRSCRSSQSNFTWVDGGAPLPELTKWEYGQPDNFYNNECCVDVLAGDKKGAGLLRDEQCMRRQGFICEIPIGPSGNLTEISTPASDGATSSESPPDQTPTPTPSRESSTVEAPSCPAGWETHGRRCYNFTREPRLTWPEARQVCQQWPGGDLLVLNDTEEQSFLWSIVEVSNFGYVLTYFWIGLHRSCRSSQSNFTWVDGGALLPELTNWETGQPDNFYNNECCVDVLAGNPKTPGLLRDEQCMRHQGFICEIPIGPSGNLTEISTPASDGATSSESPPDQTPTPTPSRESSTVEAPSCPAGWETHGRRCYNFTREPRLTWPEARQVCQQWPGGDLLVLNDSEEQSFLLSIVDHSNFGDVSTNFWIGLHRSCRSSQSNFTWVDGGAPLPELTKWEYGQPDNFYNNECCVDVLAGDKKGAGLLRDEQCMRRQGFICEIPIDPPPVAGSSSSAMECQSSTLLISSALVLTTTLQLFSCAHPGSFISRLFNDFTNKRR